MHGPVDANGIILEFGAVKKTFRHHLDTELDHRLLLNQDDPWARDLGQFDYDPKTILPGLAICVDDPTTENIARWIGEWCVKEYGEYVHQISVTVHETTVNAARWVTKL